MKTKKIPLEEKVVISSKGQIVIPKSIRSSMHLSEGEELLLRVREDNVVELVPLRQNIEDLFAIIPESYEKDRRADSELIQKYLTRKTK